MKILAAVYNTIEHDGRVRRAAEALSECAEVHVLALGSDAAYSNRYFQIERVPPSKMPGIGKLIQHLVFWVYLVRMARRVRPGVIHAHDYYLSLAGWLAARSSGAKLIYDANELLIPEPEESLTARNRFWYLLERWMIHRADIVIVANEARGTLMQSHYRLRGTPLVIKNIPPAPPISTREQVEAVLSRYPALRRTSRDDYLLVYEGDVSVGRGLERFIKAIENLPERYRLVLIGGGPDLIHLKDRYSALAKAGRINFLDKVMGESLPILLAACDIGIVSYPYHGLNNLYCAPNKIFEYAQAGLPLIATDQPQLLQMVRHYRIGECISREDGPTQVAHAIDRIAKNLGIYRACIPVFLAKHTWDHEALKLRAAVPKLLTPGYA